MNPSLLPSARLFAVKLIAITTRRNAEKPDERTPHHFHATESCSYGYLFEASVCTFQLAARCFDAYMHHVFRWRSANLPRKHTFTVSNAHRRAARKELDGKPLLTSLDSP